MTLRYRLRTLLILLAILPPLLWFGWTKYEAWRAEQARLELLKTMPLPIFSTEVFPDQFGPTWDDGTAGQRHEATVKAEQAAAYERAVQAERRRENRRATLKEP